MSKSQIIFIYYQEAYELRVYYPTVEYSIYMYNEHSHQHTTRKRFFFLFLKNKTLCWEIRGERGMEIEPKFKRICVFCGSSAGNKTSYRDAAIELGAELVKVLFLFLLLFLFSYLQKLVFDYFFSQNIVLYIL